MNKSNVKKASPQKEKYMIINNSIRYMKPMTHIKAFIKSIKVNLHFLVFSFSFGDTNDEMPTEFFSIKIIVCKPLKFLIHLLIR